MAATMSDGISLHDILEEIRGLIAESRRETGARIAEMDKKLDDGAELGRQTRELVIRLDERLTEHRAAQARRTDDRDARCAAHDTRAETLETRLVDLTRTQAAMAAERTEAQRPRNWPAATSAVVGIGSLLLAVAIVITDLDRPTNPTGQPTPTTTVTVNP